LFYNEKAPAVHFNDHAVKRHLGLISYIGLNDSPVIFHPLFNQDDEESVYRLFDREDIDRDKPTVLFHPSSLWPTKLWVQNKMAKLSDLLQKNFGCQIVYIGSAEDNEYLNKICSSANERIINLAGKTTLRELACLISKSALLVSTDSGPMHMACAVKTPVVALFGPTAPWRTGPFGENNTVIRKDISCSPCYSRKNCPEGNHLCMAKIEVEDVYKACCNYLGRGIEL
jgi:lipopolysaccharide heptosyltransferase II